MCVFTGNGFVFKIFILQNISLNYFKAYAIICFFASLYSRCK